MKWCLEELTEDAIVAYIKATTSSDLRISAAWDRDEMQYPAVVIFASSTGPVSEDAEWHDARELDVSVAVITEAAPILDASSGVVITTARERNQNARSDVMDALFTTNLKTNLNNQAVEDVAFSMAQFVSTERSVEGNNLITTITGTVISEPVTGS